ncbi:ribosomal protein L11, putative [Eimeria mitis]|uniref:Ribosomal protein L11, putative n=1 Tax=Eimeria mitis TaxID=44415 RepID=U6JXJ7_9EIME|nr:ribosomal protein L11, putative [Eimeria mitis]CDJ30144.1 ribosomal protein L11, putative [Eimeria mitis]
MNNLGRFRLIVPAANAKPSPSIGQTLGPLGINMMAFCKEFNARTSKIRPGVPVQVTIVPNPDRAAAAGLFRVATSHLTSILLKTFKFSLRTPSSTWFLLRVARCPMGSEHAGKDIVGNVTLKEIYHIAKCKSMDWPLIGLSLQSICRSLIGSARAMGIQSICRSLIGSARAMGIQVTPQLLPAFSKRDYTPVEDLEQMRKDLRQRRKAARRASAKA